MDKISLENFPKLRSESTLGPSMICGRWVSSASQASFEDTSVSEKIISEGSSPTKSTEITFKPFVDDIPNGKKRCLNWRQYLKDDKYTIDSYNFEKHRAEFREENRVLNNDLNRTRADDPYFKKPSNLGTLQEIASFYCNSTGICYQQGLLEIIAPFLKLRSSTFRTRHCYAYFASFMRNYFPNILTPITVNNLTELPHLNATINYCGILLDYHANRISNILKEMDLDIGGFITPWVMTLFSQGSKMELVYDIFDRYMDQRDKLFIFYLVIALILTKEDEIVELYEQNQDKLITYFIRTLKEEAIKSSNDIESLVNLAKTVKACTPKSFETKLIQMGLVNTEILSIEEYSEYLSSRYKGSIMEIFPFESALITKDLLSLEGDAALRKEPEFKFLDCRKNKEKKSIPFSLEIPDSAFRDFSQLKGFIQDCCLKEENTHLILLKSGNANKEEDGFVESVLHLLRAHNKNYISLAMGGYAAIMKEMDHEKLNSRKKKTNEKPRFIDRIKSLWTKTLS